MLLRMLIPSLASNTLKLSVLGLVKFFSSLPEVSIGICVDKAVAKVGGLLIGKRLFNGSASLLFSCRVLIINLQQH